MTRTKNVKVSHRAGMTKMLNKQAATSKYSREVKLELMSFGLFKYHPYLFMNIHAQ